MPLGRSVVLAQAIGRQGHNWRGGQLALAGCNSRGGVDFRLVASLLELQLLPLVAVLGDRLGMLGELLSLCLIHLLKSQCVIFALRQVTERCGDRLVLAIRRRSRSRGVFCSAQCAGVEGSR